MPIVVFLADPVPTLIQMITGGASQTSGLTQTNGVLSSSGDVLSTVADYAQILGLAAPAAKDAADTLVTSIADQIAQAGGSSVDEIGELNGVIAGATAAATGPGVVLLLSGLIGVLAALGGSGQAAQTQEMNDILDAVNEVENGVLAVYWQGKLSPLASFWTPVQSYLNDLASEGTGGPDVQNKKSDYHTAAQNFVITLVSNPFGSQGYWVVLAEPAGDVPQSSNPMPGWGQFGWEINSWYGHFPARNTAGGAPGATVVDPVTMSPALALGLQSYLLIESLLNSIDPTQLTLQQFVNDFRTELQGYLDFLYGNYQLGVNGIVKTDLPSEGEILGLLWYMTQVEGVFASPSTNQGQPTSQSWGAPWPSPSTNPGPMFSGNGWAWNGRYGASLTYPQYGYYGNVAVDQTGNNWYTTAYMVSVPNGANFISQWQQAGVLYSSGSNTYVSIESLQNWTIPWLLNKLILGRMARWKALYILNGFDKVWSVLQAYQRITGLADVPPIMRLTQDNMIASGDWWCRELSTVVLIQGNLLSGNGYVNTNNQFIIETSYSGGGSVSGHSVAALAGFLYNIAMGNWAGPPTLVPPLPNLTTPGPPRPLSLRSLLAGSALN